MAKKFLLCRSMTLTLVLSAIMLALGIAAPSTTLATATAPSVTLTATATVPGTAAPSQLPKACRQMATPRMICVVKSAGSRATLYAIENGTVIRTLDARTGDPGGSNKVTRVGSHKLFKKSRDHKTIDKGLPMPFSLFFYKGQAIHYSSNFAKVGWNGHSDGCVNLRDRKAAEDLFNWMPLHGTINVVARPS